MTLEFDPVLLTGVEAIDRQHGELFAKIGALLDAARARQGRAQVPEMLDYLGRYVVEHFATEEKVMDAAGYPKLEAHRQEHRQFVKEVEALRRDLEKEGATPLVVIRVGARVTEWLREHIYRTDRLLGEFLRGAR